MSQTVATAQILLPSPKNLLQNLQGLTHPCSSGKKPPAPQLEGLA